uniref:Uncharacterized protein n=1 Tax=Clastoptera arizonana TaxID=38151 RepID=A0A1B6CH01_9HEMI
MLLRIVVVVFLWSNTLCKIKDPSLDPKMLPKINARVFEVHIIAKHAMDEVEVDEPPITYPWLKKLLDGERTVLALIKKAWINSKEDKRYVFLEYIFSLMDELNNGTKLSIKKKQDKAALILEKIDDLKRHLIRMGVDEYPSICDVLMLM